MEPSTGVHQFELTDALGRSHSYLVMEHPAGEGMALMYELLGLGAPGVLALAGAALKSQEMAASIAGALAGEGGGVSAADVADLGRMLADLDLEKLGGEIAKALGTGRAPALTRKLLARTHRNGKSLSDDLTFGQAYQANYAELLQAVWRVCSINRFFPVPSTSASSSSAKGKADRQPPELLAG